MSLQNLVVGASIVLGLTIAICVICLIWRAPSHCVKSPHSAKSAPGPPGPPAGAVVTTDAPTDSGAVSMQTTTLEPVGTSKTYSMEVGPDGKPVGALGLQLTNTTSTVDSTDTYVVTLTFPDATDYLHQLMFTPSSVTRPQPSDASGSHFNLITSPQVYAGTTDNILRGILSSTYQYAAYDSTRGPTTFSVYVYGLPTARTAGRTRLTITSVITSITSKNVSPAPAVSDLLLVVRPPTVSTSPWVFEFTNQFTERVGCVVTCTLKYTAP